MAEPNLLHCQLDASRTSLTNSKSVVAINAEKIYEGLSYTEDAGFIVAVVLGIGTVTSRLPGFRNPWLLATLGQGQPFRVGRHGHPHENSEKN
jgi:hypothetical protein